MSKTFTRGRTIAAMAEGEADMPATMFTRARTGFVAALGSLCLLAIAPAGALAAAQIATSTSPSSSPQGTPVTDTATLSGGSNPTGYIEFYLYPASNQACDGPEISNSIRNVAGNGTYTSTPVTPPPGTYHWLVIYFPSNGDGAVVSPCNSPGETFVVTNPAPSYSQVVLAGAPVGYWRFGESSGTTATDSSGHGNDGTYLNGPLLGVPGALAGDPDTAVSLDGIDDLVRVPDADSLDVGDSFTLEGWIKRSSDTKTHQMFLKAGGFQLTVMNAANGNQVWLRKANVSTIARSQTGVPANTAYHHIVATKDGPNSAKLYIDGVQSTVGVSPAQVIPNTTFPLTFGSASSTRSNFDEFAIYDQALTPAQVLNHYQTGHGA